MKSKKYFIGFLITFALILTLLGGTVALIDPYFHYHGPTSFAKYELNQERYQNNGIVKHFEYDAIITGSSMTQCFRPSELNELFGVNAIKVPYSGGSYKEVNDNLVVATNYNSDIKMVVRCLDANRFFNDKDTMDYDNCPTYLYDDFVWNDAAYLFNKEILLTAIKNFRGFLAEGAKTVSFDMYSNWSDYEVYGKEAVMAHYDRELVEIVEEQATITAEEYATMDANIEQNITSLAQEHPEIEFYIYFSPYSIYWFDYNDRQGLLDKQLLAEKYFIEKLLQYDNIHLFSFFLEEDVICNEDNYRDMAHHRGEINSQILQWMKEGKWELTKENYEEYCKQEWDYFHNFDYDSLFE